MSEIHPPPEMIAASLARIDGLRKQLVAEKEALAVVVAAAVKWRDARQACLDRIATMDIGAGESASAWMADLGKAESELAAAVREHQLETA